MSLKFLNPYGTNKIVLFEVRYTSDWHIFELFVFVFLGMCGGVYGAFFIKASKFWATTFRRNKFIKTHPVLELSLVALATGAISYWNRYVKLAVSELLFELASPCSGNPSDHSGLCPKPDEIPSTILYLLVALAIKSVLTYVPFSDIKSNTNPIRVVTFGTKVPAGGRSVFLRCLCTKANWFTVYVPTMVIGGIMGHVVGLTVEYAV